MRFLLAIRCFFKVLLDVAFARRVASLLDAEPNPSIEVLQAMQRDGRLIDFLMEDIGPYDDEQVGATVRSIHQGCRRALLESYEIVPVRPEDEGADLEVPEGFDPREIRLVGNVTSHGPYRGVLKHRGWRISSVKLKLLPEGEGEGEGQSNRVITPAEIEVP